MGGFSTHFLESCFHYSTFAALFLGGFAVVAAFVAGFSGYEVADRLQKESDEKISATNARAEEARAVSEQAKERAAQAEARAAEANLELARFKAPRSLNDAQRNTIRDRLLPLRVPLINIFNFGETPEIVSLTRSLRVAFDAAAWNPLVWNAVGGGAVSGILVLTKIGSDRKTESDADAVVSVLKEVGLSAARGPSFADGQLPAMLNGPDWGSRAGVSIRVYVGAKP